MGDRKVERHFFPSFGDLLRARDIFCAPRSAGACVTARRIVHARTTRRMILAT
jgi:hypothetical protein